MNTFYKVLSVLYFVGGLLHVLDLFDLRLQFSAMPMGWKLWIIYLALFDLIAAVGLWRLSCWGLYAFLLVSLSQLIAYTFFENYFGDQEMLIIFHLITISIFLICRFGTTRAGMQS